MNVSQKKQYFPYLIIVGTGLIVFLNSLFNGFVWDDIYQVVTNPILRTADYSYYFTHTIGPFYKPLMFSTYVLLYQGFGLSPFIFHLFQLLMHIVIAGLIFQLFKKLSKKPQLSLVLALIFLIHPINAEVVNYVACAQEVLFMFFGLLALYSYSKNAFGKYTYIGTALLILLSFLSKESGILFILLFPFVPLIFPRKDKYIPTLFAVCMFSVYLLIRYKLVGSINTHQYNIVVPNVMVSAPLAERLMSIPKIIFTYLTLLVFPVNLSIQSWVVTHITFQDFTWPLIVDTFFLGLIVVAGFYIYRKQKTYLKIYIFFLIWFCLGMGFHLQILPLDKTIADRWFYFPFIGLLGIILSLVMNFEVVEERTKRILLAASIVVLILFAGITIQRNTQWYSGITLFSHDIKGQENVYEIQYNYGYALMEAQQYDEAIVHFQKALSLFPHSPVVLGNLCYSYLHGNKLDAAKNCFIKLTQKENSAGNYAPLILVHLLQNNPEEAKKTAQSALNKWPYDGLLWKGLGLAEYKLNDMKSAQSSFEKSYTLLPDKTTAYYLDQIKNGKPIEMKEL